MKLLFFTEIFMGIEIEVLILLTNLNMYPINIMFHGAGVVGWTVAGFLSKDKAILTNFGLQIPLFIIGFYQLLV